MGEKPRRVQLRRTKGWRKPEGAVIVSRPSGWGNPFRVGDVYRFHDPDRGIVLGVVANPEAAVLRFRQFLARHPDLVAKVREELHGHDLACWCPLDQPCHGDVLLEIANGADDA